jgi:hypothetical protein
MLDREEIARLLSNAAATRFRATDRRSWEYGWFMADYRRSDEAAIDTDAGPVALEPKGIESYERAVELLLHDPDIQQRYDTKELWGTVANMVMTLPNQAESRELAARLDILLNPGYSLVVQLIANVTWDGNPLAISNMVIGKLTPEWIQLVNESAGERPDLDHPLARQWLEYQRLETQKIDTETDRVKVEKDIEEETEGLIQQDTEESTDDTRNIWPDPRASGRPPVVVAIWAKLQLEKAEHESRRRLQELINLGLFLEPDPETLEIYLVRGSRNRPGLRGLVVLDRGAIGAGLADTPWTRELGAETLIVSKFGIRPMGSWHHTEPIPLDRLLAPEHRSKQISSLLDVDTPLTRRFTIAARWYAEAYWAEETLDAVLALAIALDTLIGDPSGLPLRATSERFALLEPNSRLRDQRAKRYQEIFGVRSAVAHGSISSKAESWEFLSDMANDVRWAAGRILALRDKFSPVSQDDLRRVFDELRWGTLTWN